jgi:hypothetical protein
MSPTLRVIDGVGGWMSIDQGAMMLNPIVGLARFELATL